MTTGRINQVTIVAGQGGKQVATHSPVLRRGRVVNKEGYRDQGPKYQLKTTTLAIRYSLM